MATTTTSISNTPLFVDYNTLTNLYGVADNQDSAKVASESRQAGKTDDELNQILAPLGLQAVNGQIQSVDGFTLTAQNAGPVVGGQAVVLPPVSGDIAHPAAVADKVNWMQSTAGADDGALMWLELSTLAIGAMHDIDDAHKLKDALQDSKIDAKTAEITAKKAEIEAEKKEADQKLTTACIVAAVEIAASVASAALSAAGAISQATATVITTVASAAANVYQAAQNQQDVNNGPQAEMNKQKVNQLRWQKMQEMDQMGIDDAQSNYEQARDLFKLALKILTDHYEQQTQAVQAITRS
jgi:hypothetical protein